MTISGRHPTTNCRIHLSAGTRENAITIAKFTTEKIVQRVPTAFNFSIIGKFRGTEWVIYQYHEFETKEKEDNFKSIQPFNGIKDVDILVGLD